jgi:plasmid stabilization system protein ParE
MIISVLEAAEHDLSEAATYYNREREGLGFEFLAEVYAVFERISSFPQAWTLIDTENRRCPIKRFPYNIIYRVENTEITILAVSHQQKKPDSWRSRLREAARNNLPTSLALRQAQGAVDG